MLIINATFISLLSRSSPFAAETPENAFVPSFTSIPMIANTGVACFYISTTFHGVLTYFFVAIEIFESREELFYFGFMVDQLALILLCRSYLKNILNARNIEVQCTTGIKS